ncbi:MAG TPA: methyl-accepting chemotaxis protein [Thermoanaerobaculia bacterium]|nr:methyl-accepting chemotaxis protein [Thermoanaerobaculia bacterium]
MVNLQQVRGTGVRFTLPYVLRFSGLWILVTTLVAVVFAVTSYLMMFDRLSDDARGDLALVLTIQTALVVGAVLLLAVFSTHRLAGPMIALRRAMEDVKAGKLDRELHFRRTDPHLGELEVAFNEMMESVRGRAGS